MRKHRNATTDHRTRIGLRADGMPNRAMRRHAPGQALVARWAAIGAALDALYGYGEPK